MTTNSQQPHLKQKQKQTKQTTRIAKSQRWESHGGLSAGGGGKGRENK